MNAIFEIEPAQVNSSGIVIPVQTDAPKVSSSAPAGVEFIEDMPESFLVGWNDYHAGRVVDMERALGDEPPPE